MSRARRSSAARRSVPIWRRELSIPFRLFFALVGAFALWLVWWLVTRNEFISPLLLPPPAEVVDAFTRLWQRPYLGETLGGHIAVSLRIALGGWAVAGIVGVPLGIAMAWWPRVRWVVFPIFQLVRPIPPLAWIPLAIVWLGIGDVARIFVVFLAAVVPWVMNSMQAVESVDDILVRAARSLGASDATILRRVIVRTSVPTILGGARIALGNAWMTLIAAELLAASAGLGFITLNSSKSLDTDIMVVAMLTIGVLGAVFTLAMQGLLHVLAPWSRGER